MENSTLFNYFQNLRQRVKALAPENDGNDVVSFTKIVMADLSEKSYTYNPQGCDVTLSNPYSGSDKKRLNGYSWDREGISLKNGGKKRMNYSPINLKLLNDLNYM